MAGTNTSVTIYTFSRDLWVGSEKVTVISMYSQVVSGEEIANLRSRYSTGTVKHRIAIMVPDGCDLSSVPEDIRVITMSSFGYDAGKLVWLTKKKNAKKFTSDLPASKVPAAPKAS